MIWPKADILEALEIQTIQGILPDAAGLEIDTRRMMAGGMFLAFRGRNTDGHDHLAAAAERGAVLAIVEQLQ